MNDKELIKSQNIRLGIIKRICSPKLTLDMLKKITEAIEKIAKGAA